MSAFLGLILAGSSHEVRKRTVGIGEHIATHILRQMPALNARPLFASLSKEA